MDDFKEIAERGAFYLSRLKTTMNVYIQNAPDAIEYLMDGRVKKSSLYTQIQLEDILESLSPGEVMEIPDAYIGQQKKLCTRLVLYKLTEEQLKKRQFMRLRTRKRE